MYLISADKRLFLPFLLSAFLLALFALYRQHQTLSWNIIRKNLFAADFWLTRSSLVDLGYLFLNSLVRILVLVPLFASKLMATIVVARFFQAQFDTPVDLAWSATTVIMCYTLLYFIVDDFSRFALHFAMHKVPWLWYFHKVHHSASILTPLTLHRVHPLEMTLYYLRDLLVFALISGFFVYLFGARVGSLEILGVGALGFIFNMLGANLRHSHIWLGFGKAEAWVVSPAQHQLHHSAAETHRNINFGTCLAVWDRLFGVWRASGQRPNNLRFGIQQSSQLTQ